MKTLIHFLCLSLAAVTAAAEPLYIEQVDLAATDEQKLQETHKQIKEHKDITLKEDIFVSPFHKQSQKKVTDKKSFCFTCHRDPPHNKDERRRSFLNMHSRYISCETCHFFSENVRLEYRWLNFNENKNKVAAKRITPFYNEEAAIIFSDHKLAAQARKTWKNKSDIEKAKLKLRLHIPLSEEGPECLDCHNNKNPLLDLEALGFDKKEITKLQQHAIPRFFSRFKKEDQRLRMSDLLQ